MKNYVLRFQLVMNFLLSSLGQKLRNQLRFNQSQARGNNSEIRTIAEYNRVILVKQGREQFTKLVEKGLSVPIALL